MSPDSQKPISKRGLFSDGSNLVVLISILLVSLSIALGLNIHLGMDLALASVVGFSLFVGLVGFQVWQKTSSENKALKEEIDFLEAEVERIKAPSNAARLDSEVYKPVRIPIQTSFLEEKTPPPSGASISIVKENDVEAIQQRIKDMLSQVSSPEQPEVQSEDASLEPSSQVSIHSEENKTEAPSNPEKSLDMLRNAMQSLRPKPKVSSTDSLPEPVSDLTPSVPISTSEDNTSSSEVRFSFETKSDAPAVLDSDDVQQALRGGRVDVFLEPILSLGEHTAKHYEVSIKLRRPDNEDLGSFETENLQGRGILPLVDVACFQRSALIAERLASQGREGSVFTRSSGETLIDSNFNQMIEKEYNGRQSLFRQMVLCLRQSDIRSFRAEEQRAVAKLSSLGFRFAVLGVTDLDMNFEAMARAGFNFASLDTSVLIEGVSCPSGNIPAPEIAGYLAKRDFTLIVNGIDTEETLARIYAFGALFGKGSLFGGRRPVKADLVSRSGQVAA